jgi:hypothetical protein
LSFAPSREEGWTGDFRKLKNLSSAAVAELPWINRFPLDRARLQFLTLVLLLD